MADRMNISASLVAATIRSSKSLSATVERYGNDDKMLRRLQREVEDLIDILGSLKTTVGFKATITIPLQKLIERCNQVFQDLEVVMADFSKKSNPNLVDWAKMEFMASDISGFTDTLAGYKSTIVIGVGTMTTQESSDNHDATQYHKEMIKNTTRNLNIQLERIQDEFARIKDSTAQIDTRVYLQDEKDFAILCLQICEDARSTSLLGAIPTLADTMKNRFEAQLRAHQEQHRNGGKIIENIEHLQERFGLLILNQGPDYDREKLRLQEEISMVKQLLDIGERASKQVSYPKIHTVGEVRGGDDNDQVVFTTSADIFDVKGLSTKDRSMQLVTSTSEAIVQKVVTDRYRTDVSAPEPRDNNIQPSDQTKKSRRSADSKSDGKPSSNENRKRTGENDNIR
ncbi:hypothetical protein B0O99DRAFT_653776 [Bisporella sp. PMI_857]|nr:hypothetical protein B0O99DRAFT_653776 [Bisporella sp. PMI_857]